MAGAGAPVLMRRGERIVLAAGFGVALVLRLLVFRTFAENYDTQSYGEVVQALAAGGGPYATDRYNYSPVWAYALSGLNVAARAAGVSLSAAVGALLLIVDISTALLLARLAGGGARGAKAALLFFANPVSVLLSSYHRSFDTLAILLLLLALWLLRRDPERSALTSVALAASLLVKHVAAFHPLLFLRGGRRPSGLGVAGVVAPYVVFLASFIPFWRSSTAIVRNVLFYGGLGGLYGTDVLLLVPGVPFWVPRLLFVAAVLATVLVLRRAGVALERASLILLLVVLLFLPGIGRQYFVWPIALGALFGGPGYLVYSVIATGAFVSVSGLAPGLPHLPGWYGVWWASLLWLGLEARSFARAARSPK